MRELVEQLAQLKPVNEPLSSKMLCGTWELVYTTVQLFRASPFFQMASSFLGSAFIERPIGSGICRVILSGTGY